MGFKRFNFEDKKAKRNVHDAPLNDDSGRVVAEAVVRNLFFTNVAIKDATLKVRNLIN